MLDQKKWTLTPNEKRGRDTSLRAFVARYAEDYRDETVISLSDKTFVYMLRYSKTNDDALGFDVYKHAEENHFVHLEEEIGEPLKNAFLQYAMALEEAEEKIERNDS